LTGAISLWGKQTKITSPKNRELDVRGNLKQQEGRFVSKLYLGRRRRGNRKDMCGKTLMWIEEKAGFVNALWLKLCKNR